MTERIKARPPRPPLWHYPAIVFLSMAFPGTIFVAAAVMIAELLTDFQTSGQLRAILAGVGLLSGIPVMALFLAWEQKRWYWELTDTELVGGWLGDRRYRLDSVEWVASGLPGGIPAIIKVNRLMHPGLVNAFERGKKDAIVLKFKDGSIMPFHIHGCAGGTALMMELVKKLADRVVREAEYSEPERRLLKLPEWNRALKP